MTWIYIQTEFYSKDGCDLWTVGFYDPNGKFHSDGDYSRKDYAADRVAWLNGSRTSHRQTEIIDGIRNALDTEETGENLIAVARDAHRAELELAFKHNTEPDGDDYADRAEWNSRLDH